MFFERIKKLAGDLGFEFKGGNEEEFYDDFGDVPQDYFLNLKNK